MQMQCDYIYIQMQSTDIYNKMALPKVRGIRAFTLVELLVVIGIIALLVAILMPVLGRANLAAKRAKCLSNLRNMQMAQILYANENRGYLIQSGFTHGGHAPNEQGSWFNTLQNYYTSKLLLRSPADNSIFWDSPLMPSGAYRRTSYGINNFLDRDLCPWDGPYLKITQVRQSSATIQFLIMAGDGEFAVSDHPHVETWSGLGIPAKAAKNVWIDLYGSKKKNAESLSNYGFLDGHAETARFRDVFVDFSTNRFDPKVAQ